jgi:hypothetical protein
MLNVKTLFSTKKLFLFQKFNIKFHLPLAIEIGVELYHLLKKSNHDELKTTFNKWQLSVKTECLIN